MLLQVGIGSGNTAGTFFGDHDLWRLPQKDDGLKGKANRYLRNRPVFRANAPGDAAPAQPGRPRGGRLRARRAARRRRPSPTGRAPSSPPPRQIYGAAKTDQRATTSSPRCRTRSTRVLVARRPRARRRRAGARRAGARRPARRRLAAAVGAGQRRRRGRRGHAQPLRRQRARARRARPRAAASSAVPRRRAAAARRPPRPARARHQARPRATRSAPARSTTTSTPPRTRSGSSPTAALYQRLTGDTATTRFATAQRDWVLGANPWGVSLMIGVGSRFPRCPQHVVANLYGAARRPCSGAVVNGPNDRALFSDGLGEFFDEGRDLPVPAATATAPSPATAAASSTTCARGRPSSRRSTSPRPPRSPSR